MTDDTQLTRVVNTSPDQISPYDLLVIAWLDAKKEGSAYPILNSVR